MRRPCFCALALTALVLLPGCAGRSTGGAVTPARDRRVIAAAELQEAVAQNVPTLDQLISRSRPEWLRTTPTQTGVAGPMAASRMTPVTQISVWMDNQRLGGPEVLRTIQVSAVSEVRLLSPSEAQARLGLDNQAGAILITSR
jgi:hypothetical protein